MKMYSEEQVKLLLKEQDRNTRHRAIEVINETWAKYDANSVNYFLISLNGKIMNLNAPNPSFPSPQSITDEEMEAEIEKMLNKSEHENYFRADSRKSLSKLIYALLKTHFSLTSKEKELSEEDIDKMLYDLDKYVRKVFNNEYALPVHDCFHFTEMEEMRKIIRNHLR